MLLRRSLHPKSVWRMLPLNHTDAGEQAGELLLEGASARLMLKDCQAVAVFACTLGADFDRLVRTVQARSMADALLMDCCGSALIEEVCDALQQEILQAVPYSHGTDRFSPGYGDLPLQLQFPIIHLLDAQRKTGIHLTPSGLMNPQKSVTAFIGLSDAPQRARIRGCAYCEMKEHCTIRKGGRTCGMESK
ncbi:MAG: vitamin B12 dependent-methionine synthase activation domain-containing protein [Clostridia bacterium]|nr:vitamin B12 dependent-methionine synthase activation domain-containing protein [Clostridia bacterium]